MTHCHIPEDSDLQEHCHKNLKSHIKISVEPAAIRYLAARLQGIICKYSHLENVLKPQRITIHLYNKPENFHLNFHETKSSFCTTLKQK